MCLYVFVFVLYVCICIELLLFLAAMIMASNGADNPFAPPTAGIRDPGQDEELTPPTAVLNKIIKEEIPNTASEPNKLIPQCSTDFMHLLSSEANEISDKQQKQAICPGSGLQGTDSLGYVDHGNEAKNVMQECRNVSAKQKFQSIRPKDLGIPKEELLRQQEEWFTREQMEQIRQEKQQLQQSSV